MINIPTINSFVRVLHALPGAGEVDVFINEELLAENLAFKDMSRYLSIGPGNNRIRVFPAGERTRPLFDSEVDLPASETIVLAIIGQLSDVEVLPVLQPINSIEPQEVAIRLVNLSPDSAGLDLFLNDDAVITGVDYKQVADYVIVSPGAYSVQLRPTDDPDLILARENLTLEGGEAYSIYAVGLVDGSPALDIVSVRDALPVVEEKEDLLAETVAEPAKEVAPAVNKIKIVFKYV